MAVYTTVDDSELSRFLAVCIGEVLSFAGIAEGVELIIYYGRPKRIYPDTV